jgi:hypothetical protein
MLSPTLSASTFGKDRVDIPRLLQVVRTWLDNAGYHIQADRVQIEQMKNIAVTYHQSLMMLGALSVQRVRHDTRNRIIRASEDYPLNSAQINRLTESLEVIYNQNGYDAISLWAWYNAATELHKAGRTDIPAIMPQNLALASFINGMIG